MGTNQKKVVVVVVDGGGGGGSEDLEPFEEFDLHCHYHQTCLTSSRFRSRVPY